MTWCMHIEQGPSHTTAALPDVPSEIQACKHVCVNTLDHVSLSPFSYLYQLIYASYPILYQLIMHGALPWSQTWSESGQQARIYSVLQLPVSAQVVLLLSCQPAIDQVRLHIANLPSWTLHRKVTDMDKQGTPEATRQYATVSYRYIQETHRPFSPKRKSPAYWLNQAYM